MKGLVAWLAQLAQLARAVAWLAIAAVLSLGAAGIVAAMAHQPGTPSRAELTYVADQRLEPGLAEAEKGLLALLDEVRDLGELSRGALTALVGSDAETLASTVAKGDELTATIESHSARLRRELEGLPGTGPDASLTTSPQLRHRHALALIALDATDGLSTAWSSLAAGSVRATRLTVLLVEHDRVSGEAAAAGRGGKYAEALKLLDRSDDMIAEARALRDGLAATVDVTTLTQWLDLNAAYDGALRELYQSVLDSKGRVTDRVRKAFAAEKTARERLPSDTKGLVIILAEVGRGGLNQAVIAIEEARGELEAAIDQLTAEDEGPSGDNPAPEAP